MTRPRDAAQPADGPWVIVARLACLRVVRLRVGSASRPAFPNWEEAGASAIF